MSETKTHYRKVFKSDHLGRADLEDYIEEGNRDLIFTISHVRQEIGAKVAGKKIDANIAYFKERGVKPLVLNATNSNTMRKLTGSCFVENWRDVTVQLYIDETAKLKGETVGGVRISPNAPRVSRMQIVPNGKGWESAKAAFLRDGNLKAVLAKADMTPEHQQQLMSEASNG